MSLNEPLDWKVPRFAWGILEDRTEEKWGDSKQYRGLEANLVMREYLDLDGGNEAEEFLDELVRASGRRPAEKNEKTIVHR